MIGAAWLVVLTLMFASTAGFVSASIGWITTPFAIFLAMILLAIAERRKLVASSRPGRKVTMPKFQKIILAIFVALVLALVFIGGLTKQ